MLAIYLLHRQKSQNPVPKVSASRIMAFTSTHSDTVSKQPQRPTTKFDCNQMFRACTLKVQNALNTLNIHVGSFILHFTPYKQLIFMSFFFHNEIYIRDICGYWTFIKNAVSIWCQIGQIVCKVLVYFMTLSQSLIFWQICDIGWT